MSLLAAVAFVFVAKSQANLVTGSIWENVTTVAPTVNLEGSLANVATVSAGRSADVTFTVNSPIAFSTVGTSGTIGEFLSSGGAAINTGAASAGNTVQNTLFYVTGFVTMLNGQSFNVQHDDGVQLLIGGTMVVDRPGPTAPVVTPYTWTGASGTYAFELAYAENSGLPGVLNIDLPFSAAPVPEPTTIIAGAMLLVPFGASLIRNRRKRSAV